MPFVKRNDSGDIVAVSQYQDEVYTEELDQNDPALRKFILDMTKDQSLMTQSDLDFVRVVEDLVDLLVQKNYILFTELPEKAQEKMQARQALRGKMASRLDLLDDEEDGFFKGL